MDEFKRNAETTYNGIRAELPDFCADTAVFAAAWNGSVFWQSEPHQAGELAGENLYFDYARNTAHAAASDLVFWSVLSVENEYRRLQIYSHYFGMFVELRRIFC